jgi:hypothetical protein
MAGTTPCRAPNQNALTINSDGSYSPVVDLQARVDAAPYKVRVIFKASEPFVYSSYREEHALRHERHALNRLGKPDVLGAAHEIVGVERARWAGVDMGEGE